MVANPKAAGERINGVDVRTLLDATAAIRENSALGKCRFEVKNQWLDGGHTRTVVKDYYAAGRDHAGRTRPLVVESDIPSLIGGGGRAMDPLECLLAALAGSVATCLVWHASERGVHVNAIYTHAEGDIDLSGCLGLNADTRPGFSEIRVVVQLDAEAIDSELDALVELARRYSPLVDTITRGTRLTISRRKSCR